jgi:hypothetical protein
MLKVVSGWPTLRIPVLHRHGGGPRKTWIGLTGLTVGFGGGSAVVHGSVIPFRRVLLQKLTMSRSEQLRKHLRSTVLGLAIATGASAATPTHLSLNAPTCAQQTENFRLTCRSECERSSRLFKQQCLQDCDNPDKLLEYLRKCEERTKSA